MKVLVVGRTEIGDTISNTLPIIRVLKEQGHTIHFVGQTLTTLRLILNFPYVDYCWPVCDKADLPNIIEPYDIVYTCAGAVLEVIGSFENVVKFQESPEIFYRPEKQLANIGLKFRDELRLIDLAWYRDYYKDFECKSNSVLLNCESDGLSRVYRKGAELKVYLEDKGFDVREFDTSIDIRTNLHLVHQAPYILTVDTSTLWMARALAKEPYMILSEDAYPKEVYRQRLRCENIVPWRTHLNKLQAEEIANCFEKAVKARGCKLL